MDKIEKYFSKYSNGKYKNFHEVIKKTRESGDENEVIKTARLLEPLITDIIMTKNIMSKEFPL